MNQIIITGNLTKEVKVISDKFAVMRIASNYKDRDGNIQSMYLDVKIFSLQDLDYFKPEKGDRVTVTGKLVIDEYEASGKKEIGMGILCDHFEKIWRQGKPDETKEAPKSSGTPTGGRF